MAHFNYMDAGKKSQSQSSCLQSNAISYVMEIECDLFWFCWIARDFISVTIWCEPIIRTSRYFENVGGTGSNVTHHNQDNILPGCRASTKWLNSAERFSVKLNPWKLMQNADIKCWLSWNIQWVPRNCSDLSAWLWCSLLFSYYSLNTNANFNFALAHRSNIDPTM